MSKTKSTFSLRRFQSLFALAIMVGALSILSDNFLTPDNLANMQILRLEHRGQYSNEAPGQKNFKRGHGSKTAWSQRGTSQTRR